MCSYLQSEQCHPVDLLNLLITSREMFSVFLRYCLLNVPQSGFLVWYKNVCGNLKVHWQLRKFCNQSHLFVAYKSEWLFVVANSLTEKS